MWRVLVAALKQETATFNPVRTRYDDFHVATGEEIFAAYGAHCDHEMGRIVEMVQSLPDVLAGFV